MLKEIKEKLEEVGEKLNITKYGQETPIISDASFDRSARESLLSNIENAGERVRIFIAYKEREKELEIQKEVEEVVAKIKNIYKEGSIEAGHPGYSQIGKEFAKLKDLIMSRQAPKDELVQKGIVEQIETLEEIYENGPEKVKERIEKLEGYINKDESWKAKVILTDKIKARESYTMENIEPEGMTKVKTEQVTPDKRNDQREIKEDNKLRELKSAGEQIGAKLTEMSKEMQKRQDTITGEEQYLKIIMSRIKSDKMLTNDNEKLILRARYNQIDNKTIGNLLDSLESIITKDANKNDVDSPENKRIRNVINSIKEANSRYIVAKDNAMKIEHNGVPEGAHQEKRRRIDILRRLSSRNSFTYTPKAIDEIAEKLETLIKKMDIRKDQIDMGNENDKDPRIQSLGNYLENMADILNSIKDADKPKYEKYFEYANDTKQYLDDKINDKQNKNVEHIPNITVSHETSSQSVNAKENNQYVNVEKNNNFVSKYNQGENRWQKECTKEIDKTQIKKIALEIVEDFIEKGISDPSNIKSYDIEYEKDGKYRLQIIKKDTKEVETYYIDKDEFTKDPKGFVFKISNEKERKMLKDPDTYTVPELNPEIKTLGKYITSLKELRNDLGIYKEEMSGAVKNIETNMEVKDKNGNYIGDDGKIFREQEMYIEKMHGTKLEQKLNRDSIIDKYKNVLEKDNNGGKEPDEIIRGIGEDFRKNSRILDIEDKDGKNNKSIKNNHTPTNNLNFGE